MTVQRSFFAELQRRHVYKVGAMYAVAGWLLVQVVTQVLPIFDVSALIQRLIVLAIVAGFPLALVLAWLFDITPHGIVRTDSLVAALPTPALALQRHGTERRLNYAFAVLLLLALGYFVAERTVLKSGQAAASNNDKSIAVLPFENLSDDKDNAYFADGIQDEILTRLAKIGALKVISRTSTQQYAAKPGNLTEIARALGVANLLEGSVQKIGNGVHINVQLIRAASDEHLWAESYNRKLDDVFAVEGEVAQTVADALQATLSPAEQEAVTMRPTANLEAYAALQRGRAIESSTYSFDEERKALDEYEEALRLDPQFALAWAYASMTGSFLHFNGIDVPQSRSEAILQAADRAQSLQPQLGEAWLAQGYYRYRVLRDLNGALQAFESAHRSLPNSPQVLSAIERVERRLGHWDQAVAHKRQALELDPRNVQVMLESSNELYAYLRRFDDARAVLQQALAIAPGNTTAICELAQIEQLDGRLERAAQMLAQLPADPTQLDLLICSAPLTQLLYQRNYASAIAQLEGYMPAQDTPIAQSNLIQLALSLAQAQSWAGHEDDARRTFTRIVRSIKPTDDARVPITEVELPGVLALAYAGLGDKAKALEAARANVEAYRDDAVDLVGAQVILAQVQAQTGERVAAIAALPELLKVPAGLTVAELRYDPVWDPLRNDAAFRKLIGEAAQP